MTIPDAVSPLLALPHAYRAFYGAFPHLYPIQRQAIAPVLREQDLLVQSATGTGKTEAVLAPCLERVIASGRETAVVYVVPTRALAVDLARRIGPVITDRLGLRLGIRTGDVKRAGGGHPDLLLTTPESLDVVLGSANPDVRRFVRRVRTIVIDEVHPLVYTCRGQQLAYLLHRLERRIGGPIQKIALSATIADADAVIQFFHFRPDAVRLLEPVQREIVPHLVHLEQEDYECVALFDDLYDGWGYRKILVFANSRGRCDRLFSLLSGSGRFHGVVDLHYSNLKPKERRGVEDRFRRRRHAVCVATSTLELGIDIGDVDAVVLYEPPDSVSAFLQRIGRSNRRRPRTHVWGVCRGEQAAGQLLRFLALLRLARQGAIEAPCPKALPSVLIQQTLSCLYEKKRLSLAALQDLFPEQGETLAALFPVLLQQGWLRRERVNGLVRGGYRYRDCLLEQRIWSNFPEAEEAYTLAFSGEAVADLPASVVRQLNPGDRVQLTGKRMQILRVEAGARKQVIARPALQTDERDIFWLGAGFRVSYEVAQSIRALLHAPAETTEGLFSRTRRLLQKEWERGGRMATLANGIEAGRTPHGLYRYRTFLGSLGNLMLQWAVERYAGDRDEDEEFFVASDEIGLECSHRIDFQALPLPTDRAAFRHWVARHLEPLRTLFPLNAFCDALPYPFLIEELTGFLFDARVAGAFAAYRAASSEIVEGAAALLEAAAIPAEPKEEIEPAAPAEPLLAWERQRWGIEDARGATPLPSDARYRPRALTGTMVGEYFRHRQCERWLGFGFLPPGQRPPMRIRADTERAAQRTEAGRRHEARVLDHLRSGAGELVRVGETDEAGRIRPLRDRFEASMARLAELLGRVERAPAPVRYLAQAVLMAPGMLASALDPPAGWLREIDGAGIPDLIRITKGKQKIVLEVGDIKDSIAPYESQKWQVAFYAALLKEILRHSSFPTPVEVAPHGFLITRPHGEAPCPEHAFELAPYAAAFPALLRNIARILLRPPHEAEYRLERHCTTCPYFEYCYRQALQTEDIQFLPGLTPGTLRKFRRLGLPTIEAAGAWIEEPDGENPFSPYQRERLAARLTALHTNRIRRRERKTRLFPVNLSDALFVHLIEDPVSGEPRGVGLQGMAQDGTVREAQTWIIADETASTAVRQAFSEAFLKAWHAGIDAGRGPHLFHFGESTWRALQAWGEETPLAFLWKPGRTHHTDLRRVLAEHFDFPAPGALTLFAVGRLLGLPPEPEPPESLFHPDDDVGTASGEGVGRALEETLARETALWRWVAGRLDSTWTQPTWETDATESQETAYLHFLEEEQRLREEDVLTLQAYPLPERVERFRALGPLSFSEKTLDEEGRFLYRFHAAPEVGFSKFREGDFLKLAPVGASDLQEGLSVILDAYDRNTGTLCVRSRRGPLPLSRRLSYSLEEDLTDWNGPKLIHAVRTVFSDDPPHPLSKLLNGAWGESRPRADAEWVEGWLQAFGDASGLNAAQRRALALPFLRRVCLIEGPPGTGKTHLLGWTLIALIRHAAEQGRPMRIAVSALTHQAIDHVLKKVVELIDRHALKDFPGRCFKWGRPVEEEAEAGAAMRVEPLTDAEELVAARHAIVGATGFGLYNLFEGQRGVFPGVFDWVVFDEASQVLIPQALLSLLYGKGNYLFTGDVRQLPPIVSGKYEETAETGVGRSVLGHLLDRYGEAHRVRLDRTYRMNAALCAFPSRTWYDGVLRAAPGNAQARLVLSGPRRGDRIDEILDPGRPVTLVTADHENCHQKADVEVEIMARLAHRLMACHGLSAEQLALIAPHRAQNNAMADRLGQRLGPGVALPLIDTVERVQGAERDVILYAFTTSDPDHVMREFLNNPNRFNVAVTRARRKLIVVGSPAFFSTIPPDEEGLTANACFKAFVEFCRARGSRFIWEETAPVMEKTGSPPLGPSPP